MKKKIIFSVAHSYDVIFFYRLISESNITSHYEIYVIFQESKSFTGKLAITKKLLKKISSNIVFIEQNSFVFYGRNIFKHIYNGLKFKKILKHNFDKNTPILLTDFSAFGSYILLNYFKNNILFQLPRDKLDLNQYRLSFKKIFMSNILNFFIGNKFIKIYELKSEANYIKYFMSSIKQNIIFIVNDNTKKNTINFSNSIANYDGKKIVIFGSGYYGWGLSNDSLDRIDEFHNIIYLKFKDDYSFVYLKHPLESKEEFETIKKIFNNDIYEECNYLNSEHYLLENRDISCCFSIGSLSSKSAYDMGFNSFVFYKLILLNPNVEMVYSNLFVDMPDEININFEITNSNMNIEKLKSNFQTLNNLLDSKD